MKKNKELKTTLEQQFLAYSSEAVARCLGITVENLPAAPGAPSPVIRAAADSVVPGSARRPGRILRGPDPGSDGRRPASAKRAAQGGRQ